MRKRIGLALATALVTAMMAVAPASAAKPPCGFGCTGGIETSQQAQEAIKTIKAESRGQGGLTGEQKAQVEALKQLRQQLKKQGL